MAVEQGSGGAGSSGICTISSSDLVGLVDNLLSRMQNLEQVLNLLTGMNVTTSSLDQISQALGTVTDATLINAANGWITSGTFTGVAISTLGWTMSDGNQFPIVVMQDGHLVFGFDTNGNISGTGAGLAGRLAYLQSVGTILPFGAAPQSDSVDWEISKDETGLMSLTSLTSFHVETSGFYLVSLAAQVTTNNAADGHVTVSCSFGGQPSAIEDIDDRRNVGPMIYVPISTSIGPASASYTSSRFMYIDTAATGSVLAALSGTGLSAGVGSATLTFALLQAEQL